MPSLYLHPANPLWRPAAHNSMGSALREFGLAGPLIEETKVNEYVAGDRFMERIVFLGCSPQLPLAPAQPGDGQQPCYIHLHDNREVSFLCATRRPAVRCGDCRTAAGLSEPDCYDSVFLCEKCGMESLYSDLDWRKSAGFGRFFIEIKGVYPHEAVPSDALLNRLDALSDCRWKYFYLHGGQ